MISTAYPSNPAAVPPAPKPAIRTTVTLLLLMHLFALLVAVLSNEPTSGLLRALREAPGVVPYLKLLGQDSGHRVEYTSGSYRTDLNSSGDTDIDFQMEAILQLPNGEKKRVLLPDPAMKGPQYRRYQHLAWQIAAQAIAAEQTGDEGEESILPKAIGTSLLRQYQAADMRFRCRGHVPLSLDEFHSDDPRVRNPLSESYFTKPYEASIKATRNGVIVVKISANRESAPAAK